jgi:hypothetical protein
MVKNVDLITIGRAMAIERPPDISISIRMLFITTPRQPARY